MVNKVSSLHNYNSCYYGPTIIIAIRTYMYACFYLNTGYNYYITFIFRCQGYKRVIKVIQFLPCNKYYYTGGKGSS